MNRTMYFLAVFAGSLLTSPEIGLHPMLALLIGISVIVAGCFRWEHMGYHPAWGLLTLLPLVPFYGMVMPKNSKTEGIDAAGKAWAIFILSIIIFGVLVIAFNG